jgi:hypothetical protein
MTTKHTHDANFGRRVAGCPRCAELSAGAQPVRWRKSRDAQAVVGVRAHFASERHQSGGCGPVCTYGEW